MPKKATAQQINDLADYAKQFAHIALAALTEVAERGETDSARVAAASALLDRGYGRPPQSVAVTGANGGALLVEVTRKVIRAP